MSLRVPVFVYGPPMSGKTTNAEALRQHYELAGVRDGWRPGDPVVMGYLHLTNEEIEGGISIDIALHSLRTHPGRGRFAT